MKLTFKDRYKARLSKGLDCGDWVLLAWLASFFVKIPTAFWVVVWVQFALSVILAIFESCKMDAEP